jgi:YgiT-type zinc finger domain-containing protein
MKRAYAPFHIDRKGYHLSLEAVPAWVCGQCGEAYFDEREVKAIQRLLQQLDKQTTTLPSVASTEARKPVFRAIGNAVGRCIQVSTRDHV